MSWRGATDSTTRKKRGIAFVRFLCTALGLCTFGARADVVLTTLHSFHSSQDGSNCVSALVEGSDGCFYGTTIAGGAYNNGTVFKISPAGAFANLHSFTHGVDGANPYAGLMQGNDGNFYGTTFNGGTNDSGTVFKIAAEGTFASLHSFSPNSDGSCVYGALAQGSDRNLFGATYHGGSWGTVFKIDPNGSFSTLYWFTGFGDGAYPTVGVINGSDGNFYGTTSEGAQHNNGTVFQCTPGGVVTGLYSFARVNDGWSPNGLVQGRDGNLYATTEYGISNGVYGAWGYGSVFKISTNGVYTVLYFFTVGNDGGNPYSGLVQGVDGNFYGTTPQGGTNGFGTIFKITPAGAFTSLFSFTGGEDGKNPYAGLVLGDDSSLYGTTCYGGAGGAGTIFRITVAPTFHAAKSANKTLTLTWSTDVGSTYQLQYKSDLSSDNWINLGNPVTATGPTLNATDSVANDPQRFYRLVLLPQ